MPVKKIQSNAPTTLPIISKDQQKIDFSIRNADAYQARVISDLKRFRKWAGKDAKLILGETGLPNNEAIKSSEWSKMLDTVLTTARSENISFFYWGLFHKNNNYNLNPYNWNSNKYEDTYLSSSLEKHLDANFSGINYAYLEFDDPYIVETINIEHIQFLKSKGVKNIRLPIRLDYIYEFGSSTPKTTLNLGLTGQGHIDEITKFLNLCYESGIQVLVEVHNYSEYGKGIVANRLGPSTRVNWHKAYTALLTAPIKWNDGSFIKLMDHSALVMFGLMNEPNFTVGETAGWEIESQTLVDLLRNNIKFKKDIVVNIGGYSSLLNLFGDHPNGTWINDPLSKTWYDGHQYFDYTNSPFPNQGIYNGSTYTGELAQATSIVSSSLVPASLDTRKGVSDFKYISSLSFTGFGDLSENIVVPADADFMTIVIASQANNEVLPSQISLGSQTIKLLSNSSLSDPRITIFSVKNPVNASLSITVAGNRNVLIDFFSGVSDSVVNNSTASNETIPTKKTVAEYRNTVNASVTLIYSISKGITVANTSTLEDAKKTGDSYMADWGFNIYGHFTQNGGKSNHKKIVTFSESGNNYRNTSIELITVNPEILTTI